VCVCVCVCACACVHVCVCARALVWFKRTSKYSVYLMSHCEFELIPCVCIVIY
jgi:hypothetical protein